MCEKQYLAIVKLTASRTWHWRGKGHLFCTAFKTASRNVNSTVTTWLPHQSRYPSEPELFLFLSAAAQIRRYPEKYKHHTRNFVQELLGDCNYRDFSI
jgi:hypothetical protein